MRLTTRLLDAIIEMSAIASANGAEGDYAGSDMEAMDRAGEWARQELAYRKGARKEEKTK